MSKKKQVTFADIAEYTNFSKTTISRYFNHPDSLTLENQEKISQALDTLGYKKNKLAKVLANGKSEFIGIIVPNLYLHYYSEMLTQFLSSYRDYHYKFLVFVSEHGAEEEQQYIEELLSYQIEGLIVLSHTLPSENSLPTRFLSSQLNAKQNISAASILTTIWEHFRLLLC